MNPSGKKLTDIVDKSSKSIYFSILPQKTSFHPSQEKWNNTFPSNPPTDDIQWQTIYKTPFQSLRETKLQSFQIKILYRIVPCNQYLQRLRIKGNDKCDYCNETDTLEHFLYYCAKVQTLWLQFRSWFERETHIHLDVSPKEYFFGVKHPSPNVKVINTLLLYFKFYVHRQKLFHECELNILSLLAEIKTKLRAEKMVCAIQNRNHNFDKWKNILAPLG